jgi:hypothetical protein
LQIAGAPNGKGIRYGSVIQAQLKKERTMTSTSMTQKLLKKLIFTSIVICSAVSLSSAAQDRYQQQEWRPAPVYQQEINRNYNYVYYPQQQVYFSPSNNNWFWASGRGWQVSTRLPSYLNVDLRFGGIPISLHSERPYAEHVYVERSYGRPWRESYESRHYYDVRRDDERHHDRRDEQEHDRDEGHDRGHHHGHDER